MSDGEGMRGVLSGDGDDDLSMHGGNDIEQLMCAILARDERVLRESTAEVEVHVLVHVAVLHEQDETVPELLQLVDLHSVVESAAQRMACLD